MKEGVGEGRLLKFGARFSIEPELLVSTGFDANALFRGCTNPAWCLAIRVQLNDIYVPYPGY